MPCVWYASHRMGLFDITFRTLALMRHSSARNELLSYSCDDWLKSLSSSSGNGHPIPQYIVVQSSIIACIQTRMLVHFLFFVPYIDEGTRYMNPERRA